MLLVSNFVQECVVLHTLAHPVSTVCTMQKPWKMSSCHAGTTFPLLMVRLWVGSSACNSCAGFAALLLRQSAVSLCCMKDGRKCQLPMRAAMHLTCISTNTD